MSELRRRMLMDNTGGYIPSQQWVEIAKITTIGTTEVSLPKYREIGFFIVGGGGSGHGDFYKSGESGNGGNGGCVNSFIVPFTSSSCLVIVGSGGAKVNPQTFSNNGLPSSVVYNRSTYRSDGGYGATNSRSSNNGLNTKQENSGIGGYARWAGYNNQEMYEWCSTHTPMDGTHPSSTWAYGGKGEDGLPNPFDESDTNLYGAGGGAGENSYNYTEYYRGPAIPGGNNGGGYGGFGSNNSIDNSGKDATFYGGGGGGGSFSSSHIYGYGGAGYQGIVIIYGKSDE